MLKYVSLGNNILLTRADKASVTSENNQINELHTLLPSGVLNGQLGLISLAWGDKNIQTLL